ncbi:VWA domain-containing protein [Nocardia sp. CDC186]|uniref:VWA domain-containing protein n=1 Tax=Nocardia implantans TaxID=3108168 RepID=A0ABU6B193_9NOCA|nr:MULTISPECIES: VWA domain-containing protein [unclassified Nocardia]MEA3531969.1 VWA domain-containing protein [Nocardia sp. CDC192]MEB3513441.1 VWA domain-containing protein [Nocardia sp. CDC186]
MTTPDRYSYGPYHDGPDPLAPPLDLREALDRIGRDVMEGSSPRNAMQELLRRGTRTMPGLEELTRRLWQRRAEIARSHRLDGTLQQVRALLEEALEAERGALFPDPSDDARFAEAQLDALPSSTAAAVTELADYPWRSETGRENYQKIRDLLGRELLESRFQGMKEALRNTTPQDVERVRRMMSDLNDLLAAHARGEDTEQRFAEFMAEHGEFFPENPRDTEELIDALAARAAAAQRMMNSMSEQQRAELSELIGQAFGDPAIAQQVAALDANLRALRPGEDWNSARRFRGEDPLGLGAGAQALQDLAELDALAEQLGQSYAGARLEDIDLDALERHLGADASVDAARLAELERELRRQGIFERAQDGSLRLTPKALRRLGETALRDVVGRLRSRRGERDTALAGAAGEPTGGSRAWRFGDTEPWDVSRTVRNAVLRSASTGDRRVRLDVSDVEIMETEQRSRAAVALCVDTSWSMVQDGRWVPMKRTALALHHLIGTRFRSDALSVITFGRHATTVDIGELTALEGVWEQGTNLHHALLLAAAHLRRHPDAVPVVLVVTDGEPTAHLEPDGETYFNWPPAQRTLAVTMAQVDALAELGASVTVFMLGEDPRLAAFVDLMARRSGGRVVAPDLDGLGAAVVSDYLRGRR